MLKPLFALAAPFAVASFATMAVAAPTLPTAADCIKADTVVCAFRLVRDADLAGGGSGLLNAPAGLPKIDHIELRRLDDGLLLLMEYFAPDPALQGVAF